MRPMQPQPTNRELRKALRAWRILLSQTSYVALLALRDKRTTWFDDNEIELRRNIDEALRLAVSP